MHSMFYNVPLVTIFSNILWHFLVLSKVFTMSYWIKCLWAQLSGTYVCMGSEVSMMLIVFSTHLNLFYVTPLQTVKCTV